MSISTKVDEVLKIFEQYSEGKGVHSEIRNGDTLKIYVQPDKVSIIDKLQLYKWGCYAIENHFEVALY